MLLSSINTNSSSRSSSRISNNAKDDSKNNSIVANSTHINNDDDRTEDDDNVFVVRKLLRQNQSTHTNLRGRRHVVARIASKGVDKAVRLETSIMIIAVYFMIGLGVIPLHALSNPNLYFSWH